MKTIHWHRILLFKYLNRMLRSGENPVNFYNNLIQKRMVIIKNQQLRFTFYEILQWSCKQHWAAVLDVELELTPGQVLVLSDTVSSRLTQGIDARTLPELFRRSREVIASYWLIQWTKKIASAQTECSIKQKLHQEYMGTSSSSDNMTDLTQGVFSCLT